MGFQDTLDEQPTRGIFPQYLLSDATWRMASSIQGTVFAWLVASHLMATSQELGFFQAIILIPGVIFLLLGGVAGDHFEPRAFISRLALLATLGPAVLILTVVIGEVGLTSLLCYAIIWSTLTSLATPSRDSLLTRVSSQHIQRTVTIVGAASAGTGILGFFVAGQIDSWGILPVALVQASLMIVSVLAIRTLPSFPQIKSAETTPLTLKSTFSGLGAGFVDAWKIVPIRAATVINVVTGLINAGVYLVALPIIARDTYGGTAATFSAMLISYVGGSFIASLAIFPLMPFRYPGRWLLLTLIIPATVFLIVSLEPPFWLIVLLFAIWGANAAIWSAMARAIVQDAAPADRRARILAIYNFGLVGTAPIGALIVGTVASLVGPTLSVLLVPATSIPLMIWGFYATNLWQHTHDT